MDQSKDNREDEQQQQQQQHAEYLDRMRLFTRAGIGDDSTGVPPNSTTTTAALPPIQPNSTTTTAALPPIQPNSTTTTAALLPIPSLTTTNSGVIATIKIPSSDPISATGGSVNSLAQPNQIYADAFFNVPNDARSDFWGGITPESIPDVNIYQNKKTVAQGMMDLALFSANANQLRYVVENKEHPYFWTGVVMISISLILQVGVGVGLLLNTRYNVKDKKEICVANRISNFTIVGIFLVTVINVFISAFGVASGTSPAPVFISSRFGNGTELSDIVGFRLANGTELSDVGFRFGNVTDLNDLGTRYENATELSESNFYFQ